VTLGFESRLTSIIPAEKEFIQGRMQAVPLEERLDAVEEMIRRAKESPSIIVIFANDKLHDFLLPYLSEFSMIQSGEDYIYYSTQ
jgi:hypothetical protein